MTSIGIDLGTTNSVVAYLDADNEPKVISSPEDGNLTPSMVAFNQETGERFVGAYARNQAALNPGHTASSVKRLMGRKHDDPDVRGIAEMLTFDVTKARNGDAHIKMNHKVYSPPEISAMILQKLKQTAEDHLNNGAVTQAVITVPAYFDNIQREATIAAGRIAGLNVMRIINEPTAACLAYGLGEGRDGTVAVFDMGGGTFDISIVQISDGVFDVKATNGDSFLGGDNFDEAIAEWLMADFEAEHGVDLRSMDNYLEIVTRLLEASKQAKHELSTQLNAKISLPYLTADESGPKHIDADLSRARLENLADDLVKRSIMPCQQALEDAGLTPEDIDVALLVGGMTRMPAIREVVKEIFGKEPLNSVNPDEAVALGAAIQTGIMDGEIKDIVLLDVTPLTLGTEVKGGIFSPMIKRNTTIPTRKSGNFTTIVDNQTGIRVSVLQGERKMAANNTFLGEFVLDGIPPVPRGVPNIETTFTINADGVLEASAKDLATGNEASITIEKSSGLSDDEIEKAIEEAQRFADEDKARKARAEAKNSAEELIFKVEKIIRGDKSKLSAETVAQMQEQKDTLQRLLPKNDEDAIRSAHEELANLIYNR